MKKLFLILFMILLMATTAAAADVTLAWDRNSEPEVTGYKLHWGMTNKIPFTESVDVKNEIQYTLTGLAKDTTYFFAVTAYSPNQESTYSDILEYIVKPERVIIRIVDRPNNIKIQWE